MSSSMNNFMEAYKAVHNTESREELNAKRDWISEMNLGSLLQNDLIDIAEEVVLHLFKEGLTVKEAKDLVYGSLSDERRKDRVSRIVEAFKITFNKVDDRAPVVAREAFEQYLHGKKLQQNKSIMNSLDESKARVHRHTVAGDVAQVREGLIRIFNEKKLDAVGSEDADIDNDGDVDSSDKYLHKRRKAIGKAMGKKGMKEDVKEARNPGESLKDYGRRLNKDDSKVDLGLSSDPLNDPDDDGTGGAGYQKNISGKKAIRMASKKGMKEGHDGSYLETDMKKRQKNNEKARKEMEKVKGQKNPHFEGTDFEELLRTSGKFSENEILKILSDL